MQSVIFVSQNPQTIDEYITKLTTTWSISPFDIQKIQEETLGIEQVRNLQKNLYLAPYKGTYKLLCLYNADTLTSEAQNALLKVLEEPPVHTFFLLIAKTEEAFLPTVLSRCTVVKEKKEATPISDEEKAIISEDVAILLGQDIAPKLLLAEKKSDEKNNTTKWLEDLINVAHQELLTDDDPHKAQLLISLLKTSEILTRYSVNKRLLLENTFLS